MSLSKSDILDWLSFDQKAAPAQTSTFHIDQPETFEEFAPPTLDGAVVINDPEVELCISDEGYSDAEPATAPDPEIGHLNFDELEEYEKTLAGENERTRTGTGRVFPHIACHNPLTRGRLGRLAAADICFTPASALFKFPWKHLHPRIGEPVGEEFFARQRVLDWSWDM